MKELEGLVVLIGGVGALATTGGLVAACLRLRSAIEFLLAAYVIGWTWLVAVSLALSPAQLLTRGWLLLALGAGLAAAVGGWLALGRPPPPPPGRAVSSVRDALRNPAVLVLAVAVALGAIYIGALAFLTPVNDWDALSYHLARADFWKQEHGLGYIDDAPDSRLNINPPNAEIGQLASMLLSGSDRYVTIAQLLAYLALALGVAGIGRRVGLPASEALFAALAFSTLPVLAVQASGALNDLVFASFLTAAAYFALGADRATLVPLSLAIGLAIGTKFTGLLALPTLALVAAVGCSIRRWPALVLAGAAGLLAGSAWYALNVIETGELDGGSADEFDQRADFGVTTLITAMRLALSFVDMSGAPWRISLLFLVGASVLALAGVLRLRSSLSRGVALLAAAVMTAGVVAYPLIFKVGVRPAYKAGLVLGAPLEFLEELSWTLNTKAESTLAWYGPLAPILLAAGLVAAVVAWHRRRQSPVALALSAAPWLLLGTLALTLTWDPWRGRFLVFGVALAAATWGSLLRSSALAYATAAIGSTALFLALANYEGKPSGLFAGRSIWGTARWEAQARVGGPMEVFRFIEESVPEDARVGISVPGDSHVHPYFGQRLSRHLVLVPRNSGIAPTEAEWLVLAPDNAVRRCPDSWQLRFAHRGWRVERRMAPDDCLTG